MKQLKLLVAIIVIVLLVGSIAATSYVVLKQEEQQKPFYIGVTYCGSSVQEAKELIDKVKNYTNLFILQSGSLMTNSAAMNEIGDYAIASNLNFAVYRGTSSYGSDIDLDQWISTAKERWGKHFMGIHYSDELGGRMLDQGTTFRYTQYIKDGVSGVIKSQDGSIQWNLNGTIFRYLSNGTITNRMSHHVSYYPNGTVTSSVGNNVYTTENITEYTPPILSYEQILEQNGIQSYDDAIKLFGEELNGSVRWSFNGTDFTYYPDGYIHSFVFHTISYYPNGTVTSSVGNNVYTTENITEYTLPILSYEQILEQNPLQNYDDAAKLFVNDGKYLLFENINKTQLNEKSILVFTSDYGLYWWDYQSGYDVVFAQLGWNHTVTQDIGLVRGAANLQGKSWGTVITWKYTQPPFLTDGEEMFKQMKNSYESGAEYVLIFNYSEDPANPNILQEEHFQALERFWNDVVQNPKIKHGNIKADTALVLPQNYGWGMRHPDDNIWGIWQPDETSQQIWNQLQNKLDKHGLKLDIVYEDPNYPVTEKYANIYYWNQK